MNSNEKKRKGVPIPSVLAAREKTIAYIAYCKTHPYIQEGPDCDEPVPRPVTLVGLCLHLGIRKRQLLELAQENERWAEFADWIIEVCEKYWVDRLCMSKNDENAKYALDNLHEFAAQRKRAEVRPADKGGLPPAIILGSPIQPKRGDADKTPDEKD